MQIPARRGVVFLSLDQRAESMTPPCVFAVPLIGPDVDPHRRIHDGIWRHVRQDLEGARHLQECQDEEEGIGKKLYNIMNVCEVVEDLRRAWEKLL